MPEQTPKCCFIPCYKDAEWEFFTGTVLTCDNACHACSDHVGQLLEGSTSTVYPIERQVQTNAA